jgi:hypothetical protein
MFELLQQYQGSGCGYCNDESTGGDHEGYPPGLRLLSCRTILCILIVRCAIRKTFEWWGHGRFALPAQTTAPHFCRK